MCQIQISLNQLLPKCPPMSHKHHQKSAKIQAMLEKDSVKDLLKFLGQRQLKEVHDHTSVLQALEARNHTIILYFIFFGLFAAFSFNFSSHDLLSPS